VLDFIETIPRYQRILIVGILLIIVFTCYYYFFVKPQLEEIRDLNAKIDSLNTQIQSIRAVESQLSQVQSLNEELKRKILGLSRILPDKANIDDFLREIVAKASEAGLTILSFIPQGEREPAVEDSEDEEDELPFVELPIRMKVLGSYEQISKFCERVSKISRIVNINDLIMKLNSDSSGRGNLIEATYVATTFRSTEPVAMEEEAEEQKEEEKEEVVAEELPTFPVGVYRDPFLSLFQVESPAGKGTKACEGFECLNVTDITLTGIIELKSGYGAIIHGNDGIGYLVTEGDTLFDGRVKTVTREYAVFSKEVKDLIRNRVFDIERVLYISPE